MVSLADAERLKRAAAATAIEEVRDGMVVGLGTGSTAAHVVELLAPRVAAGLDIMGVATSRTTEAAARAAGIRLLAPDMLAEIDLCIDGVDEIDAQLRAIKGGGGAMLLEKIVAALARRNIAIADGSKQVARLGGRAVPIEILPAARGLVAAEIARLGGTAELRLRDAAPWVTDWGHRILDARFPNLDHLPALARALSEIPGALGHGLFLTEIDALYVARSDGVSRQERPIEE
ncbi:ribose-5-phosphate isomerase RpiA [Sphingomonas sp. ABOLD]|uniref:ribose-5-phosphate isomerase RpiA n=1 Tax=unclassified Sphingomonas TaxID=196159 RepID=UPI000F7DB0A7|nr:MULTISPECIES: ribose-5-phosphate isomerase RpiA [unclassified Sphingomonas]RSV37312.1 ribose-5-phosphate isomerase RpiA [Sphingomonas sp. ABOLE]RSV45551.1 ribose-5-phosphate isomerase RpiA [Sphingomonas sp. ABOLD]